MRGEDERQAPVKAKAALIDAPTMTVVWMNESAAEGTSFAADTTIDVPLAEAVPIAEVLGVAEAAREASESGEPRHLSADLVSTGKGTMALVASVYPLPDGKLLLLIENAWQPSHAKPEPGTGRPRPRRR